MFCWDGYDLSELLERIADESGDVPLVGCSTAGEISASGTGDNGVVVKALGGTGFSAATAAARVGAAGLREASAEAAGCVAELGPGITVFFSSLPTG